MIRALGPGSLSSFLKIFIAIFSIETIVFGLCVLAASLIWRRFRIAAALLRGLPEPLVRRVIAAGSATISCTVMVGFRAL